MTTATDDLPKDVKRNETPGDEGLEEGEIPDPTDFSVKHPLQNRWTLWFDNPGRRTNLLSWSQNLREVITVDTVEDFWG